MQKKSAFVRFKNVINNPAFKKAMKMGSDIAPTIVTLSEKPTIWNGLRVVFTLGKTLIDQFEVWSHDFFDENEEWIEPFSRDFTGAMIKVLKKFPYETLKTSTEGSNIHLVKMPEGRVGWVTSSKFKNYVAQIYVESIHAEAIREKIKLLLWEQFNRKPLVLRKNQITMSTIDSDRVVLEVDDTFQPLPSAIAEEYITYLKRALDGGVHRSVMLYGPPGTGKSTAARTIISGLGLRSFRVRIEDLGSMSNNTLFEAIDIFKPEAIILDDFDRASGQSQLLETLEHFNRHIKLIVATVNYRSNLDEALLRPGRFDELILVKKMDDAVIKNVLGPDNLDQFETLKDWPIAFIQEFIERRRFMTKDEASKSIKELAERVARLGDYDEQDDMSRIRGKLIDDKPATFASKTRRSCGFKRAMMLTEVAAPDPLAEAGSEEEVLKD